MQTSSECLHHKRICSLKTARRHTSGTSCTPFSKRGVGLGHKDEATLYALAFIGLRLLLQEPDITLEKPSCISELLNESKDKTKQRV